MKKNSITVVINFTMGDGYPDIVVMKWTGDEGGRSQYTRRFIAEAADTKCLLTY